MHFLPFHPCFTSYEGGFYFVYHMEFFTCILPHAQRVFFLCSVVVERDPDLFCCLTNALFIQSKQLVYFETLLEPHHAVHSVLLNNSVWSYCLEGSNDNPLGVGLVTRTRVESAHHQICKVTQCRSALPS